MKANIFVLGLLLPLVFGCSPKLASDNQVAKDEPVTHEPGTVGERDVMLPGLSPEELKESQTLSKDFEGTYLPIKYVKLVSKSSSHLQSMRFLRDSSEAQVPSALIVEPEMLTELYNFHERVIEKIHRIEPNRITTNNGPRTEYMVNDDKTIQIDGTAYTRISSSVDSDTAISNLIVQKRLGVVDLVSEHSSLKSDVNGNLSLNNKVIQIELDPTVSQADFDWVRIEGEILFLRITGDQVDILRAHLKDGGSEWDFLPADAIFEVEESFRPRT